MAYRYSTDSGQTWLDGHYWVEEKSLEKGLSESDIKRITESIYNMLLEKVLGAPLGNGMDATLRNVVRTELSKFKQRPHILEL